MLSLLRTLVQNGDDSWPNLRRLIVEFMKGRGMTTWKELTTGVQQLVRLLFNNNFINPDLSFKSYICQCHYVDIQGAMAFQMRIVFFRIETHMMIFHISFPCKFQVLMFFLIFMPSCYDATMKFIEILRIGGGPADKGLVTKDMLLAWILHQSVLDSSH